jgi:uncharacterized protein (DUF486 family)
MKNTACSRMEVLIPVHLLKLKNKPFLTVIFVSWGIAFLEY